MRTLDRYIVSSFLTTFFAALLVLTFVMSIGAIFKINDLISKGVPWAPIFTIFLAGIPNSLTFTVPISALVASLLAFGRFSADGEISAMKACGISMWRIAAAPLIIALIAAAACLFVNSEVSPRSHFAQRTAMNKLANLSPLELLEEGVFIQDFEGFTLFVEKRIDRRLFNVRIYDLRTTPHREIRAQSGTVILTNKPNMIIDLRNVRVDPIMTNRPGALFCERWPVVIPDAFKERTYRKKNTNYTGAELLQGIRDVKALDPYLAPEFYPRKRMGLIVELTKRIVLALSCFTFVLLGIPLGTNTHRKESSIGIGISLALVTVFYIFLVLGETMAKYPQTHPYLILCLPVLASLGLGAYLINRNN